MTHIDLRIMEAAALELEQQAKMAAAVHRQVGQLLEESRRIYRRRVEREGSAVGRSFDLLPAGRCLREALAGLERETHSLTLAAQALQRTALLYRLAQERARDVMHGEILVIPRTEFGTSHFENLRKHDALISGFADSEASVALHVRRAETLQGNSCETGAELEVGADLKGIL